VSKQSTGWPHPSYLGEHLLLDVLGVLLQSNHLDGHLVDHLALLLSIGLQHLYLLRLPFNLPNEVVDHVGQLLDLNVLNVNTTIQFVHHLPYLVSSIPNEIDMFVQTIDQMILLMINMTNLVIQDVDLHKKLSSYGGSILGIPLAPHLALSLLRLKQSLFQQAIQ
jgi:hypothetical protein